VPDDAANRSVALRNWLISCDFQSIKTGAAEGTRTPNLLIRSQMLYPIELRLLQRHLSKSPFLWGVKSDFFERSRAWSVVLIVKPDALLPFAIAAIMGFLVLGLRGEKELDFSKIRGQVQFVDNFADYKVKAVESSPDLRVKIVEYFPDAPGEWQVVDSFPDYKIQLVDSFPDFTIQYVNSLPGPTK
jgi:hypothetical protein